MAEIRENIQEFVSWLTATVLGDPLGALLVYLWLGLMFIVGVVTSMRWTGRQLRRIFRRRRPHSISRWGSVPKSPPNVAPAAANVSPTPPSVPLRLDNGPRDWEQRLT